MLTSVPGGGGSTGYEDISSLLDCGSCTRSSRNLHVVGQGALKGYWVKNLRRG